MSQKKRWDGAFIFDLIFWEDGDVKCWNKKKYLDDRLIEFTVFGVKTLLAEFVMSLGHLCGDTEKSENDISL